MDVYIYLYICISVYIHRYSHMSRMYLCVCVCVFVCVWMVTHIREGKYTKMYTTGYAFVMDTLWDCRCSCGGWGRLDYVH